MKKIPRKLKKKIPKGFYCYTPIMYDWTTGIYHIELCPFYGHIKLKEIPINQRPKWMDDEYVNEYGNKMESWCRLVKTDIEDQCKSCGIKLDLKKC